MSTTTRSTSRTGVFDGTAEVLDGQILTAGGRSQTTTVASTNACAADSVVLLTVQINNLDYAAIAAGEQLIESLQDAAVAVIADIAHVSPRDVQVSVLPGSVTLRAALSVGAGGLAAVLRLLALLHWRLGVLQAALTKSLVGISGLNALATGSVFVGRVDLARGSGDDVASFLAGQALGEPGPALPWYDTLGRAAALLIFVCCAAPLCHGLVRGFRGGGSTAKTRDALRASGQGWKRPDGDAWYNPVMVADQPSPLLPAGYEDSFFGGSGGGSPSSGDVRAVDPMRTLRGGAVLSQGLLGEAPHAVDFDRAPSPYASGFSGVPSPCASGYSGYSANGRRTLPALQSRPPVSTDLLGIYSAPQDPLPSHLRPRVVEIERAQPLGVDAASWLPAGDPRPLAALYPPAATQREGAAWLTPGGRGSFVAAAEPVQSPMASQGFRGVGSAAAASSVVDRMLYSGRGTSSVADRMLYNGQGAGGRELQPDLRPAGAVLQRPAYTSDVVSAMLGGVRGAT